MINKEKYDEHIRRLLERWTTASPAILYKYRSWTQPFHQKLITEKQLYFADPITLNDGWDGGNPVRWDLLTYEDCLELNKELIPASLNLSNEEMNQWAKKMIDNKDGYYPNMNFPGSLPVYTGEPHIGIVSLSAHYDNPLLWAYYGDGHQGFVVGFDSKELNHHYGPLMLEPIRYVDDYPEIRVGDWDEFRKKYCTKLKSWQHEAEWRLIVNKLSLKRNFDQRVLTLSADTIKEIIIGAKATDETKKQIVDTVRQKLPGTIVKQASLIFQGANKMNFTVIH